MSEFLASQCANRQISSSSTGFTAQFGIPSTSNSVRSYLCSARENNCWMKSPFPNAAHVKLIRAAVERVVNFEKLVEKSVLTNFFPLDTREKIYRPLVGVEAERARGPGEAVATPGAAHRWAQP